MTGTGTLQLAAMMGTYPKTTPLKQGAISSPLLKLDFADVEVAQKAFKDVVRNMKFEVAELAIVTFLQAYDAGKPFVLLPFVMNGGFHHKSIVVREDSTLQPQDLTGRTVAMRSYSQTTPTWVRGILMHEFGIRLEDVHWQSQEGAHVENYRDPAWVSRISSTLGLEDILRAGEVDAIIAGGGLSGNPGIRPLIPRPAEAALAWHEKTNAIPINHMVTVRKDLAETRPDVVREIYRMLQAARAAAGPAVHGTGPDLQPVGFDRIEPSLKMIVRFVHEQKLTRRLYAVEELYGNVARILG
jgi:4,5-dihydroxyphthalate decarboxylase